jgi:hypothetical protein
MMEDFSYTTGGHHGLLHKRRVGVGGYGDVHEVAIPFNLKLTFLCRVDLRNCNRKG